MYMGLLPTNIKMNYFCMKPAFLQLSVIPEKRDDYFAQKT